MKLTGHPIDHLREFAAAARTDPRKLFMAIFSQVLIFGGAILASRFGVISGSYDIMVGGLVAVLTVYITGQAYTGMKVGSNITDVVTKMTSTPPVVAATTVVTAQVDLPGDERPSPFSDRK